MCVCVHCLCASELFAFVCMRMCTRGTLRGRRGLKERQGGMHERDMQKAEYRILSLVYSRLKYACVSLYAHMNTCDTKAEVFSGEEEEVGKEDGWGGEGLTINKM